MMEGYMSAVEKLMVVIIDDAVHADTPHGRTIQRIVNGLSEFDIQVVLIASLEDAKSAYANLPEVDCILISSTLGSTQSKKNADAKHLIHEIRQRNEDIPIFLMAEPMGDAPSDFTVETLREINEYLYIMDDTPEFIAGRIRAAANRYEESLYPPFFGALVRFSKDFEYSWHTPGHAGGTAFRKSPAGRLFHKFFGEQLFRSDLSISVGELGSLLDHSGPLAEPERYAPKAFGSHRSYTVTNGSSTSNRVIMMSSVTRGDLALCDRNAHKSTEQALTMTGVLPTYLLPSRNHLGIIGPIYPERLRPEAIA